MIREDAKVKKNEDSLHTPFLLCLTVNMLCRRQGVPCWPFPLDFLHGMSLEKETTMVNLPFGQQELHSSL